MTKDGKPADLAGAKSSNTERVYLDTDFDAMELLRALWRDKLVVIVITMMFGVAAGIYAFSQPNIYKSEAKLYISANPTLLWPSRDKGHYELELFNELAGPRVRKRIAALSGEDLSVFSGVSVTRGANSAYATVSKYSTSAEEAYKSVKLFSDHSNKALKSLETEKIKVVLDRTYALMQPQNEFVQNRLADKYSQQLYTYDVQKNPEYVLVSTLKAPVKASSHIKPKRLMIITIGLIFGISLSIIIAFIRWRMSKN